MIDTSNTAPVASSAPAASAAPRKAYKHLPSFPPGPADLRARLEAVRAITKPDTLFMVFIPSGENGPIMALWSMPDYKLTNGGRFWAKGAMPHVIRLQTGYAPHFGPLIFVTRQGREIADYNALARQVKRDGLSLDAPFVNLMQWIPDGAGKVQFVAHLPKNDAETLRAELLAGKPSTRPQNDAEKAFVKRNAARLAKGKGDTQNTP